MASPFVPSPFMYGDLPQGGQLAPMVIAKPEPSNVTDVQYASGYYWLSDLNLGGTGNLFYQAGATSGSPNWTLIGGFVSTASGAASGAVTLNARAGQVTFTGVSIAGGADLTLTMTNSYVKSSSSIVQYSLSGVTTGAALSIKSITNSAGSSAVVITNGAGLTTSTANITLTFSVLKG